VLSGGDSAVNKEPDELTVHRACRGGGRDTEDRKISVQRA
jgi:hypothetical protein